MPAAQLLQLLRHLGQEVALRTSMDGQLVAVVRAPAHKGCSSSGGRLSTQ
jgi:hypothetical protein